MKHTALALVVAGMAFSSTAALAADLKNEDAVSYEAQLDDGKSIVTVVIAAGETLKDVCSTCVVTIGDSSADAEEAKLVVIRDGRVNAD